MKNTLLVFLNVLCMASGCTDDWACLSVLFTGKIRGELLAINTDVALSTNVACDLAATQHSANCTGGRARQETYVDSVRNANAALNQSTLLVDCGGSWFGSLFYFIFQGNASALMMNRAGYDVVGLMIEDFYPESALIRNYFHQLHAPLVCSNIDMSTSPTLGSIAVHTYEVKEITVMQNGVNTTRLVGFVGAIDTSLHASTRAEAAVVVNPISTTESQIRLGVRALRLAHPACNIIVLISSIRDYDTLVYIAQNVYELDVVLMAENTRINASFVSGAVWAYENIIGNNVVIMAATDKGRSVSHLDLSFDDEGNLQNWQGRQALLTSAIPFQPQAEALVERLWAQAGNITSEVVGSSEITLDADAGDKTNRLGYENTHNRFGVRWTDSTSGRVVADALYWFCPDCDIALINGGAIRTTVPAGPITVSQLMLMMPFAETVTTFQLRGDHLLLAMLGAISIGGGQGRIPQARGLRYIYNPDPSIDVNERLLDVQAFDRASNSWRPIDPKRFYKLSGTDYTFDGFDGYVAFKQFGFDATRSVVLVDALAQYLHQHSPYRGATQQQLRACLSAVVPFSRNPDTECRIILSYLTQESMAALLVETNEFTWQYVVFGPLVAIAAFVACVAINYRYQKQRYDKLMDAESDTTPLTASPGRDSSASNADTMPIGQAMGLGGVALGSLVSTTTTTVTSDGT